MQYLKLGDVSVVKQSNEKIIQYLLYYFPLFQSICHSCWFGLFSQNATANNQVSTSHVIILRASTSLFLISLRLIDFYISAVVIDVCVYCREFSGGWRMRLALASALFAR